MELPHFTPAEITAALNATKKVKKDSKDRDHYYVRDEYGRLVLFYGKPTSEQCGAFFGKAGKERRYNDVDSVVVLYKATP